MKSPRSFFHSLATKLVAKGDIFYRGHWDSLLRGDMVTYAKGQFPPDIFPTMWTDIPKDLRRPLIWDGRLLNGKMPAELSKGKITDEIVADVLMKTGVRALVIVAIIGAILTVVFGGGIFGGFGGGAPYPQWAADAGAWLPVVSWYALTIIEHVFGMLGRVTMVYLPLLLLFPVFWSFGFSTHMSRVWMNLSAAARIPTRDTQLYWRSNATTRETQYKAYCREVEFAKDYLQDKPFIPIGKATGTIRARGDNEAPAPGQIIGFDGDSIRMHNLILGGTGSGKTRLVIKPLFKRIMEANWGEGHKIGAYVTDGKGSLWKDLRGSVGGRTDVAILGTDEGQFGIDLVEGMTPLEVSTTFKAVSGQVAGKPADDFWPESASLLIMHSASVARALNMHEETVIDWTRKRKMRPFSLLGIAAIAAEEATCRSVFPRLKEIGHTLGPSMTDEQAANYIEALASAKWLERTFLELAANTRSSIIANVNVVLGKLTGAREISRRFCSGFFDKTVDVDFALKGGILFVAVGETEHGMAGKVVNVWLKTRLYIMARRRLLTDEEGCKNVSCAMFADEFQMLATTGPDSDGSFWNIARETGLFMAGAATQSLAAIQQVIGDDATRNLVNLFRSKIILKTEELTTLQFAIDLAGHMPRGFDIEGYASQTARFILEGDENSRVAEMQSMDGLMPSMFVPHVQQGEGPRLSVMKLSSQFSDQFFSSAKFPSDLAGEYGGSYASEAQGEKMAANVEMRPKIDIDELLIGSGYAFAVIQRAGGDRTDIIDLTDFEEAA